MYGELTGENGPSLRKVTLQSIADHVGVSRMTVSNAFSRPDQLSAALRERILAAAAELGYVGPDPAAQALARGRTGAVGLLLNGSVSESFADAVSSELLATVADALAEHGLALLTPPGDAGFVPARDVAVDAALAYGGSPQTAGIGWLDRRRIPMVTIDANLLPVVDVDDRSGAPPRSTWWTSATPGSASSRSRTPRSRARRTTWRRLADSYPTRERMRGWLDGLGAAGVEPVIRVAPLAPGQAAASRVRDPQPLPVELVVRGSTAPPPSSAT